ncbi:hypothetical protein D3C84_457590 [compost metagenome]
MLRGATGASDHLVAQRGQQGDGETADTTVGPGHQHLALVRGHAVALQRQDAQHRGIAGRTNGHGLGFGECTR